MHSIRRKLLITLIGALLAAGFTTAAATFFSAQTELNKFLDTHLKETAESLAQSVTHSFPLADPDHLTIIGDAQSYHIVVQVYDSANNTVWQREDQPYLPLPELWQSQAQRCQLAHLLYAGWTAHVPGGPGHGRANRTRRLVRLPRPAASLPASALHRDRRLDRGGQRPRTTREDGTLRRTPIAHVSRTHLDEGASA